MRDWVVMLRARSSVRLTGNSELTIEAGPGSIPTIKAIRLRNCTSLVDGNPLITGLFAEGWGLADTPDAAVAHLAGLAAPLLQWISTVANATVDDPEHILVYAPPTEDDIGRYVEQRHCGLELPPVTIRAVAVEDVGDAWDRLDRHPEKERILRATAHFQEALQAMVPFNRVLSAEHLYMCCENLDQVIFRRLCAESGVPATGGGKHQLAVTAGFHPIGTGNQHLNDFDSYLRAEYIFGGEGEMYRQLRDASDSFEHGYGGFAEIHATADAIVDTAVGLVRRAILREVGVPEASPLFAPYFDHAVGAWRPGIAVSGTYTSARDDAWPYFYGSTLFPEIIGMVDTNDAGGRSITFQATAGGAALLEGQTFTVDTKTLAIPVAPERTVEHSFGPVTVTHAGVAEEETLPNLDNDTSLSVLSKVVEGVRRVLKSLRLAR